jgi:hypothetical protein
VGFRFRRRERGDKRLGVKQQDATAVDKALDEARELYDAGAEFELRKLVVELFGWAPTADIRELSSQGLSGDSFYQQEIGPNWDDLDRGERSAKIEQFARFANVIARSEDIDVAGLGPIVRTKVVILAWSFDAMYSDDYLDRIVSQPERFGELEAPARS